MMKQNYLKSLFLMLMMCIGMGAWAEEVVYKTALFGTDYNSKKVGSYTDSFSATNEDFTVDIANFNNNNNGWAYIKTGNKTNASVGTITTNAAIDKAITKVVVTIDAVTASSVNSITLYSGTSANACTTSEGTFSASTGAQAITISSPVANKFYKISFDCKKGSSNGLVTVSKVEYYYDNGDQNHETSTVTAPTFDVKAGTYTEDKLVLIDNYNSDYLYAYTLDGTDPAIDENLDVTSGTLYDKNEGIEITSSCTLKAIAIDEDGNASAITSATYTINKPQVFTSLEDLVAADLTSSTYVTVSFENLPIKDIFVTQQGYRNGVYFDIQKDGKDIEIFYQNVPEEWVAGGTLSGTMTCPWTLYSGTWELAPVKDTWAWTNLTYTAPAQKTITALEVSGTPTKTEYYAGDAFETTGLVVTATYSDGTNATVTENVEWTVDPESLALGTTSVEVLACVGEIVSEVYTVNGLTVTKPEYETATYIFSTFTSDATVELTDLDGFIMTLTSGSAKPAFVSSQARIYAGGHITIKANNAIIKSIEYDYVVNANKNGVSPTIDGVEGKKDAGTWDAENKTWTGADEEVTFTTSGTAGNIGFTRLIIKFVEKNLIETSLAWSDTEATVTIGADNNVFPTLTTTPVDLEGVTFESNNTEVATIAADGTITLVKAGETTITAKYEGDAEHAAATPASYTLTVNKAPFVPTPAAEGYETVDFKQVYSSLTGNETETIEDYEGTSFAMAFAKPESSSTPTKYFANGTAVRAYTGNTITITGAEEIKYVDIAWAGTYVDDAVSITGLGTTTAVVTFSKTCRFTDITVYYNNILVLEDAKNVEENITENYHKVIVKRTIKADTWSTLCLPFDMSAEQVTANFGSDAEIKTLSGMTVEGENITLKFSNAENIECGKPYMIKTTNSVSSIAVMDAGVATGNLENVSATDGDNTVSFIGSFNGVTVSPDAGNYIISSNKFYFVNSNVNNKGFRGYFHVESASENAVKSLSMSFDDDADAIQMVENKKYDTKIYNLQGQRVNNAQKGLYIVNGRKMVK